MLPVSNFDYIDINNINNYNNLQHKMVYSDIKNFEPFIAGKCDDIEAIKQSIYKILNTKRYKHIIYSWNYGIEIDDLFGKSINYIIPTIENRIIEALSVDNRILSVENFIFNTDTKNVIKVKFDVVTIFGIVPLYKEFDL